MKKILITFAFLLSSFSFQLAKGQIPPGYYDAAAGLTGQPLFVALHGIIDNHNSVSYSSLYTYFANFDIRPDNTVWDIYSDIPGSTPPYTFHYVSADECGSYSAEGDCFNREHSFPASWFNDAYPMYSDMFHLYPTDGYVNNRRSNYAYSEVNNPTWTSINGSKLGPSSASGYSGTSFEPIDAYKGDLARGYFYMATRYYTQDGSWPGGPMTNGAQLKPWAAALLVAWANQDTVSQKEINRNNGIYAVQHNRNPYIDHPEWVNMIWGPNAGIFNASNVSLTCNVFPCPATDRCSVDLPMNINVNLSGVYVSTVSGTCVSAEITSESHKLNVDLHNLVPGYYVLAIPASDGNTYRAKILKN